MLAPLSLAFAVAITAAYGGTSPPPELSPDAARLASSVRAAVQKAGAPPPVLDGPLCRAAAELAQIGSRAGDPRAATDREAGRLALARAGALDPAPVPVAVRASSVDRAIERLAERASEEARSGAPPERAGVAVVASGDSVMAVLILSRARVALSTFPLTVDVGAIAGLSGRLLHGLTGPQVFVTPPGSTPVRLPTVPAGDGFRSDIAFSAPGRYGVEVMGVGARGPEVVALLTVFAGEPVPQTAAVPTASAEPPDVAGKERLAFSLVNALRRSRGFPDVDVDPALAAVARTYAEEMARTGQLAHRSAISGTLTDRLGRAQYVYARAAENLAEAPTLREAHDSTVESPGHLQNLLEPSWTRAGFGAALARTAGGAPAVILVELFARKPLVSRDPAADAIRAVDAQRKRQGLPPLTTDVRLSRIAQAHAEAAAASDDPGRDLDGLAERALTELGPGFTAGPEVLVISEASGAAGARSAQEPRWQRVGVGVATGPDGGKHPGQLFVVILPAARAAGAELR